MAVTMLLLRPSCRKKMRCPTPQSGAVRNSLPLAPPCEPRWARPAPMSCSAKSLYGCTVTLLCPVRRDCAVVRLLVWQAWQPILEKIWPPRVTDAAELAVDAAGATAADAPAAAGSTLGTSAAADATTVVPFACA